MFCLNKHAEQYQRYTEAVNNLTAVIKQSAAAQEHVVETNLKHFFYTGGHELTVPVMLRSRLPGESSHTTIQYNGHGDEIVGLPSSVLCSYVFLEFVVPAEYTDERLVIVRKDNEWNRDFGVYDTRGPKDLNDLYYSLQNVRAQENPGTLARKLADEEIIRSETKLRNIVDKTMMYVASVLWTQVIPKVFGPEDIKTLFHDRMNIEPTEPPWMTYRRLSATYNRVLKIELPRECSKVRDHR